MELEDLYNGAERSVRISRNVVCRGCRDSSSGKCRDCTRCPNEIVLVNRQMAPGFTVQMQEEVPSKEKCKVEPKTLTALVEKGMSDGHEIVFERESEQRPGMIPGDVIFKLRVKPHSRFRRDGNDLHIGMMISLKEALIGFRRTVTQLDGREVVIEHKGITRPGEVRQIKDEGMPIHGTPSLFGNLHVTFTVDFPSHLNAEQIKAIEANF